MYATTVLLSTKRIAETEDKKAVRFVQCDKVRATHFIKRRVHADPCDFSVINVQTDDGQGAGASWSLWIQDTAQGQGELWSLFALDVFHHKSVWPTDSTVWAEVRKWYFP